MVGSDMAGKAWDDCCFLSENVAQVGEILVTEAAKAEALANRTLLPLIEQSDFSVRPVEVDDPSQEISVYNMRPVVIFCEEM